MKLSEIYDGIPCSICGDADTDITGVCYDSREVKPGDLFFCIAGFSEDGNKYAADAVQRGAAAIAATRRHPELPVPQVLAENDRRSMAQAAAAFYGHPSRQLKMVGVTGTNGKTTTTYMVKHIAEAAGHKVGLIGTIRNMIGGEELHAERTTPESPDLQLLLRRMADSGCDLVVMEVSSHSLALDRTWDIEFDVGIFSNLTQDHLDFHGTFDNYAQAKALLFEQSRISLINKDDPCAQQMCDSAGSRFALYSAQGQADYQAADIELGAEHINYMLSLPGGGSIAVNVPVPGTFSVYNSMASAAAAIELGIDPDIVRAALACMPQVDGRFELLDTRGRDFTLILDYAHTPDSLENTLSTVRSFAGGRVVAVYGCGGNRDRTKRPVMGEVGARLADRLIVTSDNPRFEDPEAIIRDIEGGIPVDVVYSSIPDRREAIREAIATFQPGDVIVLAGKGHETYQEICGVKHDFDEKVVVREVFEELGW